VRSTHSTLRIAVVNKFLVPSGMFRVAVGWNKGLTELGHDVTTVFVRDSSRGTLSSVKRGDRTEVYLTGNLARLSEVLGSPAVLADMRGAFDTTSSPDPVSWVLAPVIGDWRHRFDLTFACEEYSALACYVAYHLFRIPFILEFHEPPSPVGPRLLRPLIFWWRRILAREAVLLIGASPRTARTYATLLGREVHTIPYGCDPVRQIVLPKSPFVLADTRWSVQRHPEFLLEIARLATGIPFVLAGSFASEESRSRFLLARHKLGLDSVVTVHEQLQEAELLKLYSSAMAYVRWAAWSEGFPPEGGPSTGVFTALSVGCPVLVDSELGLDESLREELADAVLPRDPALFAAALHRLASSPELVEAQALRSWNLAKRMTWKVRAESLIALLPKTAGAEGIERESLR
jgi:glycosyltransferase involved in cell wall biosynthesis